MDDGIGILLQPVVTAGAEEPAPIIVPLQCGHLLRFLQGIAEASLGFERTYRLYGAITAADRNQRYGNYFDFFWKARRAADLAVRLEYRQEKLHAHVQAQEISYANARGSYKTEFKVVGDDYFDDGRVTAWRCLLIENGRIVAETHSYMWE